MELKPPKAFSFVQRGNIKELEKHLNGGGFNVLEVEECSGKTILHYAVIYKSRNLAQKMVEKILNFNKQHHQEKLVDVQDKEGKTALHVAAKLGRKKIVEILLKEGAGKTIRDKDKKTPLVDIYLNVPEVIMSQYDECVHFKKEEGEESNEQLTLDFRPIIGDTEHSEQVDKMKETDIIRHLLEAEPEKVASVLQHPLVQSYLYLKYEKAYFVIMASVMSHILWYAVYAYFIFSMYFQSCPWRQLKGNGTSSEAITEVSCKGESFNFPGLPLAVISWTLSILFLAKELFEIFTVPPSRYFKQLENLGQLLVIISVIWTPWPIYEYLSGDDTVTINPWQYELAAVSVFAVWALVLSQLGKIQRLRIYLEIFVKVFKSFMFFILAFGSLLLAFAFSFCIIMPEAKSFDTPLLALPKILVMMTGELNYDDLFYNGEDAGAKASHFTTTQFIFVLFTILISIILINLLIGLTVSDTQELKDKGHIAQLSSMLEAIYLAESLAIRLFQIYPNTWLLDRLSISKRIGCSLNCFKNKKCWTEVSMDDKIDEPSRDTTGLVDLALNKKYPFPNNVMHDLRDLADNNFAKEEEENNCKTTNEDLSYQLQALPKEIEIIMKKILKDSAK